MSTGVSSKRYWGDDRNPQPSRFRAGRLEPGPAQLSSHAQFPQNVFHQTPFGESGLEQIYAHKGREQVPIRADPSPESQAGQHKRSCYQSDVALQSHNDLLELTEMESTTAAWVAPQGPSVQTRPCRNPTFKLGRPVSGEPSALARCSPPAQAEDTTVLNFPFPFSYREQLTYTA